MDMAKNGVTLYKWSLDINHDGVTDVLVGYKPTEEEQKEEQESLGLRYVASNVGFNVFIGRKEGGYIKSKYSETPTGKTEGGITIDVAQCYTGYITELKQYGIVTTTETEVEAPNNHGHSVLKRQVICYTIYGDHVKMTPLTPLLGIYEKNSIFDKYLSGSKPTNAQLEEVRP
jgi:hypothetical protein